MRVRKVPDGFPVVLNTVYASEIAADLLDAADDGVDVRVLETGKQRAASKIDDLGPRPAQGDGLLAQGRDPVAGHGQGAGRCRLPRRTRVDRAAVEQPVRRAHAGSACSWVTSRRNGTVVAGRCSSISSA